MSDAEGWPVRHFSQSLPRGDGQQSVPDLLRRVAQSIADQGEIEVQDIVFHMELDDDGDPWPTMTVYFHPPTNDDES